MKRIVNAPIVCAAVGLSLLIGCTGCGWSSRASRANTMTGVSESGYPKGSPADAGSPALGTQFRDVKHEHEPIEAPKPGDPRPGGNRAPSQ